MAAGPSAAERPHAPLRSAENGFDAVFSPEAYEAHLERDRATRRTAPAPAPGDPPWTIDGDSIRIDV